MAVNAEDEFQFETASRTQAKARIALAGPANSGKTYGALILARGLAGEKGRIGVVDSERGRAQAYAGMPGIGAFKMLTLKAPFTPDRYIKALTVAWQYFDVVVVDSLTHEWAGSGGVLEAVDRGKSGGNQFSAWKKPSADHQKLVDAVVQSPTHIICTMRSKMAYELVEETKDGRTIKVPHKLGLAPVQREGMEYEFDVMFDITSDHTARLSKCNAAYSEPLEAKLLLDGKLSTSMGAALKGWLETGELPAKPAEAQVTFSEVSSVAATITVFGQPITDKSGAAASVEDAKPAGNVDATVPAATKPGTPDSDLLAVKFPEPSQKESLDGKGQDFLSVAADITAILNKEGRSNGLVQRITSLAADATLDPNDAKDVIAKVRQFLGGDAAKAKAALQLVSCDETQKDKRLRRCDVVAVCQSLNPNPVKK